MSLTIPKSIARGILLLRQEAGSGQNSCWLVGTCEGRFPPWLSILEISAVLWGDCSHPGKSCSPQGVISLLLFLCDLPVTSTSICHFISLHQPTAWPHQVLCDIETFPLGVLGTYWCVLLPPPFAFLVGCGPF